MYYVVEITVHYIAS